MRLKIISILEDLGIAIDTESDDIDLREYIVDSIQFINFIVSIESTLETELPDTFLLYDHIASLNGFSEMLQSLETENELLTS